MDTYDEYSAESELLQNMDDHIADQRRKSFYDIDSLKRAEQIGNEYGANKLTTLNDDINSVLNCILFVEENKKTAYNFTRINIPSTLKIKPLTAPELGSVIVENPNNHEKILLTNIMRKVFNSISVDYISRSTLIPELIKMLDSNYDDTYKDEMILLTDFKQVLNNPSREKINLITSCGLFIVNSLLDQFVEIADLDKLFSQTNDNYSTNDHILKMLHDRELTTKQHNGLWVFGDESVKTKIKKIVLAEFSHMEFDLIFHIKLNQDPSKLYQEMTQQRIKYEVRKQNEDDLYTTLIPLPNYCRDMIPHFVPADSDSSDKCLFCNNFIKNGKKYYGTLFEYTSDMNEMIPLIQVLELFSHANGNFYSKCLGYLNPSISKLAVEKFLEPKDSHVNMNKLLQLNDGTSLPIINQKRIIRLKQIDTLIPTRKNNNQIFVKFMFVLFLMVFVSVAVFIVLQKHCSHSPRKNTITRRYPTIIIKERNSYYRYGEGFRTFT